jgi:hypothetical protein
MAIASLVCGIVSVVLAFCGPLAVAGVILGIIAIALSILARKNGQAGGAATAGLVLGIIGTVLSAVLFIACVACIKAIGGAVDDPKIKDLLDIQELEKLKDALNEAKESIESL